MVLGAELPRRFRYHGRRARTRNRHHPEPPPHGTANTRNHQHAEPPGLVRDCVLVSRKKIVAKREAG